jgi:hypothetical protein
MIADKIINFLLMNGKRTTFLILKKDWKKEVQSTQKSKKKIWKYIIYLKTIDSTLETILAD